MGIKGLKVPRTTEQCLPLSEYSLRAAPRDSKQRAVIVDFSVCLDG